MPAPTLDGSATGLSSGTTTVAATLTTTSTNDIVCALICIEQSAVGLWVTGVAGGGLTWQKRTQATWFPSGAASPNNAQTLELWWAVAPTALAAVTITATCNGTADDSVILVWGVAGCNTTNPWDANASLAGKLFGPPSPPTYRNISTTQANDFLIFGFGSNGSTAIGTVPTGWTAIGSRVNAGGTLSASVGAAYLGVTSTQTNQTYAWGSSITPSTCIFDALTADTGGTVTAPRPTYEILAHRNIAGPASSVTIGMAGISANDVLVILSYTAAAGTAITGISGGSLTWALRGVRSHGSTNGSLEVWAAQVTGTLAATTITITYAANFGAASVVGLAIVGCTSAIWDANAGVPVHQSNTVGGTWTPSVSVSTTQAHDLMLAVTGNTSTGASLTSVPGGFVFVDATSSAGTAQIGVAAQVRATTQTSATTAWGSTIADANNGGEYLVDALTADAAAVASTQGVRVMVLA